jgi:transcriptional regulator with XRE-family HTH domain
VTTSRWWLIVIGSDNVEGVDVATLLSSTRRKAGYSQRELARRARTSAAAVCLYERGERVPRVDTLERLLTAAGATLSLDALRAPELDLAALGEDLAAVLDLADQLPQRHEPRLTFPPFRTPVAR